MSQLVKKSSLLEQIFHALENKQFTKLILYFRSVKLYQIVYKPVCVGL